MLKYSSPRRDGDERYRIESRFKLDGDSWSVHRRKRDEG